MGGALGFPPQLHLVRAAGVAPARRWNQRSDKPGSRAQVVETLGSRLARINTLLGKLLAMPKIRYQDVLDFQGSGLFTNVPNPVPNFLRGLLQTGSAEVSFNSIPSLDPTPS